MLLSEIRRSWKHLHGDTWHRPYTSKKGEKREYTFYVKKCLNCKNFCMTMYRRKKRIFCSRKCSNGYRDMAGSKNPYWKGGKVVHPSGYEWTRNRSHANANSGGYVLTHRYIMSKHLGRPLRKNEIVHHINHNKRDNRLCNLVILSKHKHNSYHANKFWETHKLIVVPK